MKEEEERRGETGEGGARGGERGERERGAPAPAARHPLPAPATPPSRSPPQPRPARTLSAALVANLSRRSPASSYRLTTRSAVASARRALLGDHAAATTRLGASPSGALKSVAVWRNIFAACVSRPRAGAP